MIWKTAILCTILFWIWTRLFLLVAIFPGFAQTIFEKWQAAACLIRVPCNCGQCFDLFPTRLLTSEDEYRWHWHQMIYFPETINTVSTLNTISTTLSLISSKLAHTSHSVHAGIQKPWRSRLLQPSVVFSFCYDLSRPSSSLIWAQLTLFAPATGFLDPLPQDGVPIHRVRAPAPPGVRYMTH